MSVERWLGRTCAIFIPAWFALDTWINRDYSNCCRLRNRVEKFELGVWVWTYLMIRSQFTHFTAQRKNRMDPITSIPNLVLGNACEALENFAGTAELADAPD